MTARSLAISLVVVGSTACVVISDPGDDDVGDTSSSDSTSTDSTDSNSTDSDSDSTSTDSTDTDTPPDSCAGIGSSDLPGACIWFPSPGDTWSLAEAAAGIAIPYHVIVEADVPDVMPQPQDAGCGQPDASGLIVFAILQGGDQQYCLCDVGICPAPTDVFTIPAGDSAFEFEWNGVNWNGPSDTNNPYGPPFPAGEYTLEISAIGTVGGAPFEVRNTFAVTLTE